MIDFVSDVSLVVSWIHLNGFSDHRTSFQHFAVNWGFRNTFYFLIVEQTVIKLWHLNAFWCSDWPVSRWGIPVSSTHQVTVPITSDRASSLSLSASQCAAARGCGPHYESAIEEFCLAKFRLDMQELDQRQWCSWEDTVEWVNTQNTCKESQRCVHTCKRIYIYTNTNMCFPF